jgi:hypothetical protein
MSADGATKATAAEALEKLAWERYTAGDNQSIATDIAEAGAIPLLVALLRGSLEEIRERFVLIAPWALENLTIANEPDPRSGCCRGGGNPSSGEVAESRDGARFVRFRQGQAVRGE